MNEGPVLWRVAAGPRIGFGHLVRSTTLARALGVAPVVSLRSGAAARGVARRLGARLAAPSLAPAIAHLRPRLLIIDDPSRVAARQALAAARRAGLPVASVHDLGLAWIASDLLIDGSIVQRRSAGRGGRLQLARGQRALLGPKYALLNLRPDRQPSIFHSSTIRQSADRPIGQSATVLIALGGGPRVWLARAIARQLVALDPAVRVRIAGGFSKTVGPAIPRVTWIGQQPTLVTEFDRCRVAIVGGGVSAYEACARGTAAIAVAVVPAQRGTVAGLAAAGATLDGGLATTRTARVQARRVAADAIALVRNGTARRRLAARARTIVDTRGTARVARAVRELMHQQGTAPSAQRPRPGAQRPRPSA